MPELTTEFTTADRAFSPIGKALSSELGAEVFFLALDAEKWAVRYFGTRAPNLDAGEKRLTNFILKLIAKRSGQWDAVSVGEFLEGLAQKLRFDGSENSAVRGLRLAESILSTRSVDLGNSSSDDQIWALPGHSRPIKFFQKALEFASIGFIKENLSGDWKNYDKSLISSRVLVVKKYMMLQDIIDSNAAPAFIAEYATASKGNLHSLPSTSAINHYFLPLSGLGQWRAAACWLVDDEWENKLRPAQGALVSSESSRLADSNGVNHSLRYISPSHMASMNELYSQAIIESFAQHLSRQIAYSQEFGEIKFIQCFALLFWAREIAAYHDGLHVDVLNRQGNGSLTLSEEAPSAFVAPYSSQDLLSVRKETDSPYSCVQICLFSLISPTTPTTISRDFILRVFKFDTVVMKVPLMQGDPEDINRYADHLRERMIAILEFYIVQAVALQRDGMAAMAHFAKRWVEATGHRGAASKLRNLQMDGIEDIHDAQAAVRDAIASLEMFQNVIAIHGVIQMWVAVCDKQHSKLQQWISEEQRYIALQDKRVTFIRYVNFVRDAIKTVSTGFHFTGSIRYETSHEDGTISEELLTAGESPMSNIEAWVDDNEPLPPFSITEDSSSHLAILALVAEPLFNIIRYHERYVSETESRPIIIRIFHVKDGIRIIFLNPTKYKLPAYIPSLDRLKQIYQDVKLAVLEYGSIRIEGATYFRVAIELRPLEFVSKILETTA